MSQLASSVSRLESQGKLPSQTIVNPKQNVNAITLRSGKELKEPSSLAHGRALEEETKKEFAKSKKEAEEKEILKTFHKIEVNIPLLDAIKQVPRYAKVLKELCTNKRKLKETGVILQLADRSNVYLEGVLEDILVQVNELVFPTDFYVLDMQENDSSKSTSILLGRPFLKTARTKIDVDDGTLTMEFDGEIIKFNIYDAMRCPSDVSSIFVMDFIDPLAQETFDQNEDDELKDTLNMNFTSEGFRES
ncbi:uncharacterized protein LOC120213542 [Hibiscus syriacus]|uniref:uncharacterized protein LOC120213542 n=1 Tax=Hibiscus syriacus TaxID=106335 RepID=UPI0019248E7B|nr:uncharacterized protein LOC120213542 [Hibiscus syriacus]